DDDDDDALSSLTSWDDSVPTPPSKPLEHTSSDDEPPASTPVIPTTFDKSTKVQVRVIRDFPCDLSMSSLRHVYTMTKSTTCSHILGKYNKIPLYGLKRNLRFERISPHSTLSHYADENGVAYMVAAPSLEKHDASKEDV